MNEAKKPTEFLEFEGRQIGIIKCRSITYEQKPHRSENGTLYINRLPTGALLATGEDEQLYWRENAVSQWERC